MRWLVQTAGSLVMLFICGITFVVLLVFGAEVSEDLVQKICAALPVWGYSKPASRHKVMREALKESINSFLISAAFKGSGCGD